MDLKEKTTKLLHDPAVGKWMRLADNYMQAYNRMPDSFVLPAEHADLAPIIRHFAKDATAFSEYIRALRDASEGLPYDELHEVYRKVSLRALQLQRRTRLRKAVLVMLPDVEEKLGRSTKYQEQLDIAEWVEKVWGKMRTDLMDQERKELASKRINTTDRAVLLDAFWTNIDKKLAKGIVPLADHSVDEIVERLRK
jgi:hypothetical protein